MYIVGAAVGFLAFVLLWLSVVWGVVLRNGWLATRIRRQTAYGIHQLLSVLGLTLSAVHASVRLAVPGGHLLPVHLFVPFGYWRDPIGVGVAVLGLEVLLAVAVTILFQRRLGYTRWRVLHRLTYPAFLLIVAHILISGTDLASPWVWGAVLLAALVAGGLWLTTVPWLADRWRQLRGRFAPGLRPAEVTINVDPTRCARFGFCEHEAPQVFALRSDGVLAHRASVPIGALPAVSRAVEVCPTRAIALGGPPRRAWLDSGDRPAPQ